MEVEIFTLSDFAQDNSGKLTIVGTFDTIYVGSFPTNSPTCSLSMRIRVGHSEAGHHDLRIRCVDENNIEIPKLSLKGDFQVIVDPKAKYASINLVLGLLPMKLERSGRLNFELYIDDEWTRTIPLNVTQRETKLVA